MLDEKRKVITCDYCIVEDTMDNVQSNKNGCWSFGQRGYIMGFGVSGVFDRPTKYACPKQLCQAKLLVWAHS